MATSRSQSAIRMTSIEGRRRGMRTIGQGQKWNIAAERIIGIDVGTDAVHWYGTGTRVVLVLVSYHQ